MALPDDHSTVGNSTSQGVRSGLTAMLANAHVKFIAKILVTGALLFVLFRTIDPGLALQRLRSVDPILLILAVVLGASQAVLIMSSRWTIVLELLKTTVPWHRLAHFMTVSLFFNELLPSTIGGDTMRVLLLRRIGTPTRLAVQSVLLERALGLASLLLLALGGAVALLPSTPDNGPLLIIIAVALTALIFAATLILLTRLGVHLPLGFMQDIAQVLNETILALNQDRARLTILIALSFVGQLLIFLTVWLVAQALNIPLNFWHVMAVMPAIILVASVPVSLAEWGVREGAMVVGLSIVGIAPTDALTLSLVYGFVFLGLGMAAGVIWLFSNKFTGQQGLP